MAMTDDSLGKSAPDGDSLLARAATELRNEQQPTWVAVVEKITTALKTTARRTTPLAANFPGSQNTDDTLHVSDHVVRMAVAAAIGEQGALADNVEVLIEDGHYAGLMLGVAVNYGVGISTFCDTLRGHAALVVATTLGIEVAEDSVDIAITDIIVPGQ